MGTPGLRQGQASQLSEWLGVGGGDGGGQGGAGSTDGTGSEDGEPRPASTEVNDGLQERMRNVEPTPPAQVGKRRGDPFSSGSCWRAERLGREGLLQQAGVREAKPEQDEGDTAG